MKIISVVTNLYPSIDGVGDYALNLARQLRQDFAVDTHFIVANPNWSGDKKIDGFLVDIIPNRSQKDLLKLLQKIQNNHNKISTVLLHYVPHGYATKACPFWLIKGLEAWRNISVNYKLVTMFHELYALALNRPWSSDFWFSPVQKNLAARLSRYSTRCITSQRSYARKLEQFNRNKSDLIYSFPVPSNCGEPNQISPLSMRERQLIIFGRQQNKIEIYQKFQQQISDICQKLEIEKILDIGPSSNMNTYFINGIPLIEKGTLTAQEIGNLLSESIAGLLNCKSTLLGKSGVFAAYCAYGVLPINCGHQSFSCEELIANNHYLITDSQHIDFNSLEQLQIIADNAFAWYQTHRLSTQAKQFAELLI